MIPAVSGDKGQIMDNKKQLDSILAMDDSLAMVESITDGLPVDDYSPEQDKDITLDDIFGVNANDTPQTFGDQFASLGDDTKTEDGQRMITDAFVSEINKLPGTTVEISDIPQLAAIVQMRTGAKGDVEGYLMNTIMQTNKTLAEQNKSELNPGGAVSEMAKDAEQAHQGAAPGMGGADMLGGGVPGIPDASAAPTAGAGVLSEVPPIAPTPEPALDASTSDGLDSLLPPDGGMGGTPAPGGDGTLGLADIGVSDDDLAAANNALDGIPGDVGSQPTAGDSVPGVDDALAGLDKLDDSMFGDASAPATGAAGAPAAGAPATDTPAADVPAADAPAAGDDTPAAGDDTPKDDDTKDGPKTESAGMPELPPMLENALNSIHKEYVAKEAAEDARREDFVRGVVAKLEANERKTAAMVESANKRRVALDAIIESVDKKLERTAILESAAKNIAAMNDRDKATTAMLESILAETSTKMRLAGIVGKAGAMLENATAQTQKTATDAASQLHKQLGGILENAQKKHGAAMLESANQKRRRSALLESVRNTTIAARKKDAAVLTESANRVSARNAAIERIVGATAQDRINSIRSRVQSA